MLLVQRTVLVARPVEAPRAALEHEFFQPRTQDGTGRRRGVPGFSSPPEVHAAAPRVPWLGHGAVELAQVTAGRAGTAADDDYVANAMKRTHMEASHPLVRSHPVTGEKSLYCDRTYTTGIEGLSLEEGRAILDFLIEFITQPVHTCRLRWQPGTFALWDNRLCVHRAFNDYDGYRRVMYRTTIAHEWPQG